MTVREESLFFRSYGEGENLLVLIHAFPVNSNIFSRAINKMLPQNWRVLLPDLPGFGNTPEDKTRDVWTMEDLARQVHTICPNNSNKTVVGGVSMGGYITMAFAKLFPNYADAYILSNTSDLSDADGGSGRENAVKMILEGKRYEFLNNQLLERVLGPTSIEKRKDVVEITKNMFAETTDKAIIQTMRGMGKREASRAFLKSLDKPILVLCGSEDEITGPELAKSMANSYKNATYAEIPEVGHYAAIENAVTYATEIRAFLEGL